MVKIQNQGSALRPESRNIQRKVGKMAVFP